MVRMFRMDAGSNGAKFGRCGHDDGLTAVTMTIDPIDNNSIRFDQAEEEKSKKRGWEGGISKDEVVNLWSWRLRRAAARLESLPKNKSGGGSAMPLLALYCHFKKIKECRPTCFILRTLPRHRHESSSRRSSIPIRPPNFCVLNNSKIK